MGNFKIIIYISQHLKILNYANWIAQKAINRMLERLLILNKTIIYFTIEKYWQDDVCIK